MVMPEEKKRKKRHELPAFSGWRFTDDIYDDEGNLLNYLAISPSGRAYFKIQFEELQAAGGLETGEAPLLKGEAARIREAENFRAVSARLFPELFEPTGAPTFQPPRPELALTEMFERDTEGFLRSLPGRGNAEDVQAFLKAIGAEGAIPEVTPPRVGFGRFIEESPFPDMDMDDLAKLAEQDFGGFLHKFREGGWTRDKESLLRDVGFSPEDVEKIIGPALPSGFAAPKETPITRIQQDKVQKMQAILRSPDWKERFQTTPEFWDKAAWWQLAGGSMTAAIGGMASGLSGAAGRVKLKGIQKELGQIADVSMMQRPQLDPFKPGAATLIDPKFWLTQGVELGTYMTAMVPIFLIGMAVGGPVGAAIAGVSAFGRLGPLLGTIFTALVGSAGATIAEATIEAGEAFNEAERRGFTQADKIRAFDSVFGKNVTLLSGSNAAELFLSVLPGPQGAFARLMQRGWVRAISKGGRVVGGVLTEGGEEALQTAFTRQALGEKVVWDDDMKMVAMLGAIGGASFVGGGQIYTSITSRIQAKMTPEQKAEFDRNLAEASDAGFENEQAVRQALDKFASDKEGQAKVEAAVKEELKKQQVNAIQPKDKVEALAIEKLKQKVAPEVAPEAVPTVPKVEPRVAVPEWEVTFTRSGEPSQSFRMQAKTGEEARALVKEQHPEFGDLVGDVRQAPQPAVTPKVVPEAVAPTPVTPEIRIPKELSPLVDEAKKYKTFEEFELAIFSEEWRREWRFKKGLLGDVAVMGFPKATEQVTGGKYIVSGRKGLREFWESANAIPKAEPVPEAVVEEAKPLPITKETLSNQVRQIHSELEADVNIARKKIAEIKTPLPTQGADIQFARLALNDANRLTDRAKTLIDRIERGQAVSEGEVNALNDKIASLKDYYKFEAKTTEQVKAKLVEYIKSQLPLPRQGELLSKVKNVKTPEQLTEAIARVQELAEAQAEKTLRADIIRELSRTKPRVERGITVGRLSPEVQPTIDRLRANLLVGIKGKGGISRNVEAYEAARAKIEQGISDYRDGKITWEALLEANEELKYVGMYGMSSAQLQEALDYIQELKRLGKDLRKIKFDEIKEQRKEVVDKAVIEVTGGEGIKPGVGTLRGKDLAGIKKVLDQPVNSQYGFVNLLDKLGKFAKGTKMFQGFLMRFANLSQRATNTENAGREATFKIVRDKFREIYGVKKIREATRLLTTLSQEEIDLGTFKVTTKEGVKYLRLKLTKAEMMEAYQLYKNPKNLETFRDGMHWTPEIMIKIVDTLTEQDIKWADWLQAEFYSGYYDKINPFYQQEFNIDMPKNPDYVPQSRDLEAEVNELDEVLMLVNDQKRYASVTNKSLKARQENIRPFLFKGVFTVLTNHIVQMEHFMAWAETMHELRSTFGNKEVRTAIQQYHSNDILRRLDDYMNDFARGGVDRVQFLNILDKLRSNFAVSVLALKPSIGLQQIWTIGAFMTEMKAKDFVTGVANFWRHPIENYKWMMENSTYIKNRYSGGNYERDIRLAQQQGVARTMSGAGNMVQYLLWQVTQGDKFGVMPGWWAKYQSGLKARLNQADAMVGADLASERTQNTSELSSLSWLQRGSSWGKLLTMFQSQPNKYFRIIADNIRNMQYGRQSKVKGITNLLIVWVVLPMLFQWVADAFRFEKEKQARILVLGPLNNILVAGQLIQTAWGWFTDDSFDWQASPVLSTVRDFQNFSSKLKKIIGVKKDPYNDVAMDDIVSAIEFFSKGIGQLIGAPTPYLIMVERAIRDGDPRELVFSRWALEEPKPTLQGQTAKLVGQYGQVIEDVTDLPVDKKPPVYDTKKGFSEVKQALSKTLPQDVTEKNGFSPRVVAIAKTIIAQDILETFANKRLFEIIDGILDDNTLNYTFSQYYMDYQDRQKITSLAELKEWDDAHPRFNLGNVTPEQFKLMRQYEELETKAEKKQFRLDHPEMDINNRIEWLKKNPEQNALLALHGQVNLLTKEAYNQFKRLIKELDIQDSAIPVSEIWGGKVTTMPSDELITANFERNDIVDEWGANSWEDKLLRAKNPELNKWLGLGDIDTPIASLELKTEKTYRATYNKLKKEDDPDWVGNLDDKKEDKDGLTARDRKIAELKETKIGDMTWIDLDRKIEAIEKGTDEAPTPDSLVNLYIERGKSIDKAGVGSASAEVMLQRVDNPDFDAWLTDEKIWGDRALKPVDRSKIPIWRIDVKMAALDKDSPQYARLNRQRDAHINGFSDIVDVYVDWYETPKAGYHDDWFLMENKDFYDRMVGKGLLSKRDFSKVPDIKWRDEWDTMPPRKQEAIIKGIPELLLDDYVAYFEIPPKPTDYPTGFPNWEDDWWMMEHPDFYKEVYLKILGKPRKDYRKVPTREVWAKYLHYDSLDFRAEQDKYRLDNPDLDEWGVLYGIWKETMTEKRRSLSISGAERMSADIEKRLKELEEAVSSKR